MRVELQELVQPDASVKVVALFPLDDCLFLVPGGEAKDAELDGCGWCWWMRLVLTDMAQ